MEVQAAFSTTKRLSGAAEDFRPPADAVEAAKKKEPVFASQERPVAKRDRTKLLDDDPAQRGPRKSRRSAVIENRPPPAASIEEEPVLQAMGVTDDESLGLFSIFKEKDRRPSKLRLIGGSASDYKERKHPSYLVNYIENLYDYRMFLPGDKDPEDIECLEILVDRGIDREEAPEVLRLLKERFALSASNSSRPSEAEASPSAKEFEAASSGKSKEIRTVAGAPFEEFKAFADDNQWQTRRDRGLPWKADVFEFIKDTYKDWIERGKAVGRNVTQADIKAVDLPLYHRLQHDMTVFRKAGKPLPDIQLPAARDAVLSGQSEEELARINAVREHWRGANTHRKRYT